MVEGNLVLQINSKDKLVSMRESDIIWTPSQHFGIVQKLISYGCRYLKGREEYSLLKETVVPDALTEGLL